DVCSSDLRQGCYHHGCCSISYRSTQHVRIWRSGFVYQLCTLRRRLQIRHGCGTRCILCHWPAIGRTAHEYLHREEMENRKHVRRSKQRIPWLYRLLLGNIHHGDDQLYLSLSTGHHVHPYHPSEILWNQLYIRAFSSQTS